MFPTPASAHPLGNFTVNRYARVEPAGSVVRLVYVLDEAEIPTFQDQPAIDADENAFLDKRVADIQNGLALTIDGRPAELTIANRVLTQPAGQGNLPTLRIAVLFETPAPTAGAFHQLTLVDSNEPDRVGWREMAATPTGNATISGASVPEVDTTRELREYPSNLLQAPLDVRRMNMDFDPATVTPPAPSLVAGNADSTPRTADRFGDLVGSTALSAGGIAVAALLAFLFGAVHALGPGHGKSVMAAYLVGTKGRPRDAIWLGVIVAVMHTGSVLVLGFGLLLFDSTTDLARLYPALNIASGVVILSFGATLAWRRMRAVKAIANHTHDNDEIDIRPEGPHDHPHDHEHSHGHSHEDGGHHHHDDSGHSHGNGHSHDHSHEHAADHEHGTVKTETIVIEHSHGGFRHSHALPTGVAPLSRRGLLVLAGSGGLLPSPSAVIVILSAASLDRMPLGLALVGIFSIGLAAVLSAVGLSLVYGREYFSRRTGAQRAFRVLPILSAAALIVLGSVLAVRGIISL